MFFGVQEVDQMYPRVVYFLATFWSSKMFFQGSFFLKFWPYVWLVFKSGSHELDGKKVSLVLGYASPSLAAYSY